MFLESERLPEQAVKLLYRNGFALLPNRSKAKSLKHWHTETFGRYVLHLHSDSECLRAENDTVRAVLIGHAFNPETECFDASEILRSLVDLYESEPFYDLLDQLSGRFALILQKDGATTVFHDAIGSRAVFYSKRGGVVASHAEIASRAVGGYLRDFFVPFITSAGYRQRDVKYLPGHATPFEHIRQLTPNTCLDVENGRVRRYWPRKPRVAAYTDEDAHRLLKRHLTGLAQYLERRRIRPLIGLTAGSDSKSIFAALRSQDPFLFTWVRSENARQQSDAEVVYARKAAARYSLTHEVFPIKTNIKLDEIDTALGFAFRRSTGFFRGGHNAWLQPLEERGFAFADSMFVRGFGGEVLRGFYQGTPKALRSTHANQLANCYDVNAGAAVTRDLFREFKNDVKFTERSLLGRDANDMFYWEHRMGTWGSIAMSEADLVVNSCVGYNSRNLFDAFFSLPWEARHARRAFDSTAREMAPGLFED